MIEQTYHLNHFRYKKPFTGSDNHLQFRYRIIMEGEEPEASLSVVCWPGPFSFEKTPEEKKHSQSFDFSEEGYASAIAWLNEQAQALSTSSF